MYTPKLEKDILYPFEYGFDVFGGKWKPRIICALAERGVLRYSELRREMTDITDAVLSSSLKELVSDGVALRSSPDDAPQRVEYSLTDKGAAIVPILHDVCAWADTYHHADGENMLRRCQECIYKKSLPPD